MASTTDEEDDDGAAREIKKRNGANSLRYLVESLCRLAESCVIVLLALRLQKGTKPKWQIESRGGV